MKDKLWEDEFVTDMKDEQTLNGLVRTYKDKWGAVLYIKCNFEIQRIYKNKTEYLKAIRKPRN